ncbi:UNVERIFIED_CONTAM: hypothetical protein GTU68_012356 [Idotea baltica]|jgi:hypothetical protein
MPVR